MSDLPDRYTDALQEIVLLQLEVRNLKAGLVNDFPEKARGALQLQGWKSQRDWAVRSYS